MKWTNLNTDVVDALTGAPIDKSKSTWVCMTCMCRYQEDSMSVLLSENASACISCGGVDIQLEGETNMEWEAELKEQRQGGLADWEMEPDPYENDPEYKKFLEREKQRCAFIVMADYNWKPSWEKESYPGEECEFTKDGFREFKDKVGFVKVTCPTVYASLGKVLVWDDTIDPTINRFRYLEQALFAINEFIKNNQDKDYSFVLVIPEKLKAWEEPKIDTEHGFLGMMVSALERPVIKC